MIANLAIAQEQEIINYREKVKLIAKDLSSLSTNTKIVFFFMYKQRQNILCTYQN